MVGFLIRVAVNAVALAVAVWLIPGIRIGSEVTGADPSIVSTVLNYLFVGLLFGLVNAIVRPVVSLLALPLTCLTLGLFAIIINAGMLMLTTWITSFTPVDFHVDTFFWDAVLGSIVIGIVSAVIGWVVPDRFDKSD
jgi:putative membrane protein